MNKKTISERLLELQEKALIVQLGLEGVPQRSIREIVECDLNRVTRIMRRLKNRKMRGE